MGKTRAERPSIALARHAAEVIALGAECGVTDIHVFGSCATGRDIAGRKTPDWWEVTPKALLGAADLPQQA